MLDGECNGTNCWQGQPDTQRDSQVETSILPTTGLTHTGDTFPLEWGKINTVGYSGADVYKLYQEFHSACGWWNNNCKASFGINEFLGMWILFESSYDSTHGILIAKVVAQNLYVGGNRPAVCNPGNCPAAAVFNFIAAYSKGKGGLFAGPNSEAIQNAHKSHPGISASVISDLGSKALDPASVFGEDRWNSPSNWGNIPDWGNTLRDNRIQEAQFNGMNSATVYYYNGSFIVHSYFQKSHWEALGVDMTLDLDL